MEPVQATATAIEFGRFRVLPHRREVLVDGRPAELGERAFDVLMALIDSSAAVVSKDTLMERVWPNRIVEENRLQAQISVLRKAFGVDRDLIRTIAGRGYQFTGEIRVVAASPNVQATAGMSQPTPTPSRLLINLPEPVSELIGRDGDLDKILDLGASHRLVTLTGAGGIGKTRLGYEAARRLLPEFADGVWAIELAPLSDPELVPVTVATALGLELTSGVASPQSVANALRSKQLMLVLDNCEHVIDAAARMVEALLRANPSARAIATSREPLRAEGEWVYPVPPLAVPTEGSPDGEDPLRYGAVRLFVERAHAVAPHFSHDVHGVATIADICRHLDGIPLAIELAAARVATLGIEELAARLDDRFQLLTGGRRTALARHQTLRATLDWSYELLTEPERVVLRRLAIFAGGFTLQAASAVAADDKVAASEVVDSVANLVTKSLVTADAGGATVRYRLLETTRAYALEKLTDRGEFDATARRHAEYYRDLLQQAVTEWETRPSSDWVADYGRRIDDVRAALNWAFSSAGDAAIGVALAAASAPTWIEMALLTECRRWMAAALDALQPEQEGTRQEMALQLALGFALVPTQGPGGEARTALMRANQLGEAFDNLDYQLRALTGLVISSRMADELSAGLALSRQVDVIAKKISSPVALATADCLLGSSLLWVGEYAEARTRVEQGSRYNTPDVRREHRLRSGYDHFIHTQTLLAQILWLQGFSNQSLELTRNVLVEAERTSHPVSLNLALTWAGCGIPLRVGDLQMAEQSIGRLKAHAELHGAPSYYAAALGFEGQLYAARGDIQAAERSLRRAIAELGETKFYMLYTAFLSQLAEVLAAAGCLNEAFGAAEEAVERASRNKNYWCLPEALRIKGGLFLSQDAPGAAAAAEDHLRRALDWAHRQGALSWELRAATSLARLLSNQDRTVDATALLRPVYDRFTEGFATADLKAAKSLLDGLA
jgi:predicted ATPase/DNA-binding winged helix-turn-helix (wHTH) protein